MTLRSTDYALLSQATYDDPVVIGRDASGPIYKNITLDGVTYTPIAHADDPNNGFQATAYEIQDGTHQVVIAYRGTEFNREPKQDGLTDLHMAIDAVNDQSSDALKFTQGVLNKVNQDAKNGNYNLPPVAVTGHSLGGTLAEINAAKYGLHGETFNAYGAVGLKVPGMEKGIPEGGTQVIDHVRATDVVSAGSPHFGTVRPYAVQQDIDALSRSGYHDNAILNTITPHAPVLGMIQKDAHAIDNFVPNGKLLGGSIINLDKGEKLYREHSSMIDRYRTDIEHARTGLYIGYQIDKPIIAGVTAGVEGMEKTAHAAQHAAQYVDHEAAKAYDYTSGKVVQGVHAVEFGVHETARQAGVIGHLMGDQLSKDAQTVGKGIHDAAGAVSREAHSLQDDPLGFVNRMLEAARSGDRETFNKMTAQAADGEPGRAMMAQAAATVDKKELMAAHQQELAAAQQQAAQQQVAPTHQGPAMGR